jgi:succinoglycan biosynthesis protein ExoA
MTSVNAQLRTDQPAQSARGGAFISIIMPVRNEEACLGNLLRQLLAQEYDQDRYEILVVDGGSTDGTRQVVEELSAIHTNLRLLDNPRRWSSAARNIGVQMARGELLVIVDGHCTIPGDKYLRTLADAFERSGADCLGRPQPLEAPNPSRLERAIGLARASAIGHHPASYIYSSQERFVPAHSVAVAYRRTVFDQVGLFDEGFDACEDVELNHRIDRAGLRCLLVPELAVSYRPRGTLRALVRQLVRYGRGRVRLFRKHPNTLNIRTLLPALFVLGCVIGAVAMWFSKTIAAIYLLTLAVYFLLVMTASIAIAIRQREILWLLLLPLVFVTIHVSAGAGILLELASPSSASRISKFQ